MADGIVRDLCLGNCGKKVNNRLQTCRKCAHVKCVRCDVMFNQNVMAKSVCKKCMGKTKLDAARNLSAYGNTAI